MSDREKQRWDVRLSVEFGDEGPLFCAVAYDQDDDETVVCGWSADSWEVLFGLIAQSAREDKDEASVDARVRASRENGDSPKDVANVNATDDWPRCYCGQAVPDIDEVAERRGAHAFCLAAYETGLHHGEIKAAAYEGLAVLDKDTVRTEDLHKWVHKAHGKGLADAVFPLEESSGDSAKPEGGS